MGTLFARIRIFVKSHNTSRTILVRLDIRPAVPPFVVTSAPLVNTINYKVLLPPQLRLRGLRIKHFLPPLLKQREILYKVKFCLPPLLSLRVVIFGAIGNRALNL